MTKDELVALQLQHETSYNELGGHWHWSCKCGESDSFLDWNDCHKRTREHWAEEILRRLGSGEPPQPRCRPSVDELAAVMAYQHQSHTPESRKKMWDEEISPWKEQWRRTAQIVLDTFFGPSAPQPQPIWADPSEQQMEAAKAHVREFFPDSDPDAIEALARSHIQYANMPSAPSGSAGQEPTFHCKFCKQPIVNRYRTWLGEDGAGFCISPEGKSVLHEPDAEPEGRAESAAEVRLELQTVRDAEGRFYREPVVSASPACSYCLDAKENPPKLEEVAWQIYCNMYHFTNNSGLGPQWPNDAVKVWWCDIARVAGPFFTQVSQPPNPIDYAKWSREWFDFRKLSPQDFYVPDMLREFHIALGGSAAPIKEGRVMSLEEIERELAQKENAFEQLDKSGAVTCSTPEHERLRSILSISKQRSLAAPVTTAIQIAKNSIFDTQVMDAIRMRAEEGHVIHYDDFLYVLHGLLNRKSAPVSGNGTEPPDAKRVENAFDKLAEQGFFEDVKDWPQGSRDECMEILRALAGVASHNGQGWELFKLRELRKLVEACWIPETEEVKKELQRMLAALPAPPSEANGPQEKK